MLTAYNAQNETYLAAAETDVVSHTSSDLSLASLLDPPVTCNFPKAPSVSCHALSILNGYSDSFDGRSPLYFKRILLHHHIGSAVVGLNPERARLSSAKACLSLHVAFASSRVRSDLSFAAFVVCRVCVTVIKDPLGGGGDIIA